MGNYALDDEGLAHLVSKLKAYITNKVGVAADEEDTTAVDGKLKLRDRSIADGGRPYIILRKGKTFAQQVTVENAIYEVRYAFDLGGGEVTLPKGALLRFAGGVLSNGRLKGALRIEAGDVKIFDNMRFDVAGSNCVMNVKWFGAKGDYSRTTPNDYTDDTDAIQAAIDTELGVYFPAGKYAVRGITIKSWTWYADDYDQKRSKTYYGDDFHTTWLVGIEEEGDSVVSFYGCFSNFRGIYATTGNGCHYQNGFHFVKHLPGETSEMLINYADLDLTAYGNFGVCVNVQASIQYSNFKVLSTYDPETDYPYFTIPRPMKLFVLNDDYNIGGTFDLRLEYAANEVGTGIEFSVENKCQSRIRFLNEGEMNAGFFHLPCKFNAVEIYDSYTECAYGRDEIGWRIPKRLLFDECTNVVVNGGSVDYWMRNCKDMRFVNTNVPRQESINCKNIIFQDCYNMEENKGVNFLTAYIEGSLRIGHDSSRNALINTTSVPNLVSNEYEKDDASAPITGIGYSDNTHHYGLDQAVLVLSDKWKVDLLVHNAKSIFEKGAFAASYFVKPIVPIGNATLFLDSGKDTIVSVSVKFNDYAIPIGGGWYFFKLSLMVGNVPMPNDLEDVKMSLALGTDTSDGSKAQNASYYMTKVSLCAGNGVNYPWVPYAFDSDNMNASASDESSAVSMVIDNRLPNNYSVYTPNYRGELSIVGKGLEIDERCSGYDYAMKVTTDTYAPETTINGMKRCLENGFSFSAIIKPYRCTIAGIFVYISTIGASGGDDTANINIPLDWNDDRLKKKSLGNGWTKISFSVSQKSLAGFGYKDDRDLTFGFAAIAPSGSDRPDYYITQMSIIEGDRPLNPWVPMIGEEGIDISLIKSKIKSLEEKIDNTVFESTLSFNVMPSSVMIQVERVTLGNGEQSFRTKRQYEIHLELNAFMGTTKLTQFKTGYKYRFEGLRSWGLHDEMPNISFDDGKGNVTVIHARGYSRNGGPVPEGDDDYYLYEMSQDDGSLTFVIPQGTLCSVDMLDSGYGNQVNSAVFNISVYLIKPDGEEVYIPNFYAQIPITLID